MSKELIVTLFTLCLGLVPASCLSSGCAVKDSQEFATNVGTSVKAIQDLGVEAQANIYVKPNGVFVFGPAFIYGNDSYAVITVKSDPAKAKLQDKATK